MIDIVTITLNNREGLERTMNSVLSQSFFHLINYIIIDGGSTDGSKELIEQHKHNLHYWCSEPDKGIFNAFNKSIEHLTGDYVLFLNSGDYLHSDTTIEEIYDKLDADIVYGDEMMFKYTNMAMVNYTNFKPVQEQLSKYPDKLDEGFFKRSALPHQSTFIKVSLQKQHKYDESCVIAGDWKLTREAIMENGATYKHVPMIVSHYGLDGISSKKYNVFVHEKEDYYRKLKDK